MLPTGRDDELARESGQADTSERVRPLRCADGGGAATVTSAANAPDSGFFSPGGGESQFDFIAKGNLEMTASSVDFAEVHALTASKMLLDIRQGLLYRRRRRSQSQPPRGHLGFGDNGATCIRSCSAEGHVRCTDGAIRQNSGCSMDHVTAAAAVEQPLRTLGALLDNVELMDRCREIAGRLRVIADQMDRDFARRRRYNAYPLANGL